MATQPLRLLLLRERDFWVIQCLEYNIAAHGAGVHEAVDSWKEVFALKVQHDMDEGRTPLEDIGRAPMWYWKAFAHGIPLPDIVVRMPVQPAPPPTVVPPAFMLPTVPEVRLQAH
jgi:hypothetical protein